MPDPSSRDDDTDRITQGGIPADDNVRRTNRAVAEAFSGHRFRETYEHFAEDLEWVAVGASMTRGKDAVIAVCEATLAELADTTIEVVRFLSVADADRAVVDCSGRYTDPHGVLSAVSSCDFYEFAGGQVTRITSYTVEIDP